MVKLRFFVLIVPCPIMLCFLVLAAPPPSVPPSQKPRKATPPSAPQNTYGNIAPYHQQDTVYANMNTYSSTTGPDLPPRLPSNNSNNGGDYSSQQQQQQQQQQQSGQDRMLSVSGKKKCSHCKEELGKQHCRT